MRGGLSSPSRLPHVVVAFALGAVDAGLPGGVDVAAQQGSIDKLDAELETGMLKMSALSERHKIIGTELDAAWQMNLSKLKGACVKLRDRLERLAESRASCERAQTDSSQGLAYLFASSAKDQARFARFGKITGCAQPEGITAKGLETGKATGSAGGVPLEAECHCTEGSPVIGCEDSPDIVDHELLCTRILEKSVTELHALDEFRRGICKLGDTHDLLKPLFPASDFAQVRYQSMAHYFLSVLCATGAQRGQSTPRCRVRTSGDFL